MRIYVYNEATVLYYQLHGPCSTQRHAREFISSPDLVTRARLLYFNLLAPELFFKF